MCLIAFAIGADPGCPLLLAANRDEFFDRPTAALHRWTLPDGACVVAGRDLRDGGTWLGVSETGRVAMLTNVRTPRPGPGPRSRGELPLRWLRGGISHEDLQAGIEPGEFGGFNLVVGDLRRGSWSWMSNCHPDHPHEDQGQSLHSRSLPPGIYGLSNASLDTPWPKTLHLKSAISESLAHLQNGSGDAQRWMQPLTQALADASPRDDANLPDTGVPVDWERLLSSPFVSGVAHGYGTRSSVVMRMTAAPDADLAGTAWQLEMHEWGHTPEAPASVHRWNPGKPRSERIRG